MMNPLEQVEDGSLSHVSINSNTITYFRILYFGTIWRVFGVICTFTRTHDSPVELTLWLLSRVVHL